MGGAGAGLGVAHGMGGLVLTCKAEDIFFHLELKKSYRVEEGRVTVVLSGNFECPRSQINSLVKDIESINGSETDTV